MQKKRQQLDFNVFRKNQYLEFIVFDPERGKLTLTSRVIEAANSCLTIVWPQDSLGVKYFFKNVQFGIIQFLDNGSVTAFKVDVTRDMIEKFHSGKMEFPLPVFVETMTQHRIFHRVKTIVPLKFRIQQEDGHYTDEMFAGDTSDISMGGLEFSSLEMIEPGQEVELFFTLEYVDFHGLVGKILRREETNECGNLEYCYSVQFTGLFERDRMTLGHLLMRHTPGAVKPKILSNPQTAQ